MFLILARFLIFFLAFFIIFELLKRFYYLHQKYNSNRFAEIRQERLDKVQALKDKQLANELSKKIMRENSEEVASYGELFLQRNGI